MAASDHSRRNALRLSGRIVAALAFSVAADGQSFAADSYPSGPIRVVVPFVPGGAVDLVGRLVAQYLGAAFGQEVFVDNRGGAGGSIGSAYVARAAANGYTLIVQSVSSAVINGLVYKKLPYDLRHDFTPVAEIAQSPTLLVINAKLPATNLREFIALAKDNPGKFNFGSTGVGGSVHMAGVLFEAMTGTKLVHVPFRGAGPAVEALVAGETQMEVGSVIAFLPFVRSGQLRALCVNGDERIALLRDVPTAAQAGLPRFVLPDWYGMFAPHGTPDDVVARLQQAVAAMLAKPEVTQRLAGLGLSPVSKTPAEFAAYWNSEFDFWAPIVKASGVSLD